MKKFINLKGNKGFTLIEIIGVIVIMGLILIVVFPTMFKIIRGNTNEKYSSYYDLIKEASLTYASTLEDKLGSNKYEGCAEVTLQELIDNGYINKFDDDNINCVAKSEVNKEGIKIRNNKGNITINFHLSCSKGNETVYSSGDFDNRECLPYEINEEINIKNKLESSSGFSTSTVDNEVYITSNSPYIWYSGKLWRVVSYNKVTEMVKAVTDDSITSIYYNHAGVSDYANSDVATWLNSDFLNSLKDPQIFLTSSNWNPYPNTNINNDVDNTSKVQKSRVGLITTYEYGKIKSWYTSNSWLLSEGVNGKSLISQSGSVSSKDATSMYGVRPAITFSPNVLIYSGSGSLSNPYIIDNSDNATGKNNELINTRFSGEYVKLGGKNYRIVAIENGLTKVIGTSSFGNYQYSDNTFRYDSTELKKTLEGSSIYNTSYITNGDFCLDTINSGDMMAYQSSRCLSVDRINNSIKIGLPKIGDMFTSNISSVIGSYWTLNPNAEEVGGSVYNATMNVVEADGHVSALPISNEASVVVVFYLKDNVKIDGNHKGNSADPYNLKI